MSCSNEFLSLSAESPPKKRRKSNSLSEEEMLVKEKHKEGEQAEENKKPVVDQQKKKEEGQTKTATEGGSKSESTSDVGDSKKQEAMQQPSTSGGSGSGGSGSVGESGSKGKIECDARLVQFKEIEKNFDRILACVAVKKEQAKEEEDEVHEEKAPEPVEEEEADLEVQSEEIVIGEVVLEQQVEGVRAAGGEGEEVAMEENVIEGAGGSSDLLPMEEDVQEQEEVVLGSEETKEAVEQADEPSPVTGTITTKQEEEEDLVEKEKVQGEEAEKIE